MQIVFTCGPALLAGVTTVLVKKGIRTAGSTVTTALHTVMVPVGAWSTVFIVGSQTEPARLDAHSTGLLVLSGLATGASWLCYFRAFQLDNASKVVLIDKLSIVLTALLVLMFLGERMNLIGAFGVALVTVGTLLMLDAGDLHGLPRAVCDSGGWLLYILESAFFVALTAIFDKADITEVESNLGTTIRIGAVLVMTQVTVAVTGEFRETCAVSRGELGFALASGTAAYTSWLCYYRALQDGPASMVVPVDELNVLVTVPFSVLILREAIDRRYLIGLALLIGGTLTVLVS